MARAHASPANVGPHHLDLRRDKIGYDLAAPYVAADALDDWERECILAPEVPENVA